METGCLTESGDLSREQLSRSAFSMAIGDFLVAFPVAGRPSPFYVRKRRTRRPAAAVHRLLFTAAVHRLLFTAAVHRCSFSIQSWPWVDHSAAGGNGTGFQYLKD